MARFCRYCGSQISENARFCNKCGKAVPTASVQPQNSGQPQNFGQVPNSGQSQFSGQPYPAANPGLSRENGVKKKSSPLIYVFTALILVLCITGVSVGGYFLYSRFIKGGTS